MSTMKIEPGVSVTVIPASAKWTEITAPDGARYRSNGRTTQQYYEVQGQWLAVGMVLLSHAATIAQLQQDTVGRPQEPSIHLSVTLTPTQAAQLAGLLGSAPPSDAPVSLTAPLDRALDTAGYKRNKYLFSVTRNEHYKLFESMPQHEGTR